MLKRVIASALSIALVTGCASGPGAPGTGAGSNYTPVIDMQGINHVRYHRDMGECRAYSNQVDAGSEAAAGVIVGALIGAAIGSAYRLPSRYVGDVAVAGATAGGARASDRAIGKQERILINCMAGRGYRTLDAPYAVVNGANSPYAPVVYAPQPMQGAGTPVTQYATASVVSFEAPPAELGIPARDPAGPIGKDAYQAEHLPAARACQVAPRAVLTGKGPAFESYSIACANGESLSIRCEFGNCRVLR